MKQSGSSERAAGPEERTTSTAGPASRSRRHGLWSHSATPRGVRRTACATGSQGRGPPWPMPDPGAQTRKACWESRCQLTTIAGCPVRRNLHEDTSAHEQIFDLLVSAVRDCTAIGDRRRSCVLGRRLEQDYARLSWWIKIPWLPAGALCRCCGKPVPEGSLAWDYPVPDPVAFLSEAELTRRTVFRTQRIIIVTRAGQLHLRHPARAGRARPRGNPRHLAGRPRTAGMAARHGRRPPGR